MIEDVQDDFEWKGKFEEHDSVLPARRVGAFQQPQAVPKHNCHEENVHSYIKKMTFNKLTNHTWFQGVKQHILSFHHL